MPRHPDVVRKDLFDLLDKVLIYTGTEVSDVMSLVDELIASEIDAAENARG